MNKNKLFWIEMIFFFIIIFNGIHVGYSTISSYRENYPKIEYASTTNEKFYQKMVKMKRNTTEFFNGFPICLISLRSSSSGDVILSTEKKDTLFLAFEGLNYKDINRYPFYVLKDNHDNFWSLSRRNDRFHLTKRDKKEYKDLPKPQNYKPN